MALDRVRHPNTPARDRDLGPCLARVKAWDMMRRNLDVALAEPPRKVDVELRQP